MENNESKEKSSNLELVEYDTIVSLYMKTKSLKAQLDWYKRHSIELEMELAKFRNSSVNRAKCRRSRRNMVIKTKVKKVSKKIAARLTLFFDYIGIEAEHYKLLLKNYIENIKKKNQKNA